MKQLLAVFIVIACLYLGWKQFVQSNSINSTKEMSTDELRKVASTTKASDVVMYTTTECGYCAQAKSWLAQYDFAFTECNMSVSSRCESEFKGYGATGTPYLIVRGQHMKDGFDSDEFLALLKN